jgi:O-antigen/teichoic acid export membrane protein
VSAPQLSALANWIRAHPVRASTLAGWYQQLCGIGGSILSIPFILYRLGDETAGLWFALLGFVMLFALADFGFSPAISRQAAHSLKNDPTRENLPSDLFLTSAGWVGVSELYAASRAIFWKVTLGSAVLCVLAHEAVLPWTSLLPARTGESTLAWYLLGGALLVSFQTKLSQAFLDGLGWMYASRFIAGTYQLAWNLLIMVALWIRPSLAAMALVLFVTALAQFWAMHVALRRLTRGQLTFDGPAPAGMTSRLWRIALPFGFVSSGSYLESAAQVPLLGAVLGPTAVAPYYLALRITQTMQSAVGQLMTSQWPFFTQECAQGHWGGARSRMRQTIGLGLALHVGAALTFYLASPWLVELWVGPDRYLSAGVLAAIAACYLLNALAALPAHFVLASGRNPFAWTTLLHGGMTVVGVLFLCPYFGIAGVPLASIAAGLLTNFWFVPMHGWRVWRDLKSRDKAAPAS